MSGIMLPAGCCCDSEGPGSDDPCSYCSGKTPLTLEALFSNITVCTACYVIGAGPVAYKFTTPPPTPIGPYTLAQTANPCVYEYSAAVTGQINMYTLPTCPPPGLGWSLIDLKIQATFTTNKLVIYGLWTHQMGGPISFYGPSTYFFMATIDPATVCDGPWSPSNGYTTCNTNGPDYMGYGGSVSITSQWK